MVKSSTLLYSGKVKDIVIFREGEEHGWVEGGAQEPQEGHVQAGAGIQ